MAPGRSARVFATVVVVLTVLSSGYFTVSGLLAPGILVPGGDAAAPRAFAAYMAARSIVLLGGLAVFAALRAWRPLALVLALNAGVQLVDAVIGATRHEVAQTLGPACFVLLLGAAAWSLLRAPLPRPAA
ncbi:hypothetical protein HTZ77_14505 [Nonomuraea sp. SMC257]|uniref:DUF4267 domain-containing protein n=1 Tax=Nonomuraea montanisoli TaxID=2741721 RepID=A0A7Y6I939_9ACTN|nr:hypothetical protein [Nonomuraea montanisoli]NUW32634.1 hypothetical protein [Nonomuraea montanisoli]